MELPKVNPQKRGLPKRRDYVGALAWLKVVRDCLGGKIVFALDEALIWLGHFSGRSRFFDTQNRRNVLRSGGF